MGPTAYLDDEWARRKPEPPVGERILTALLLTCRQVYLEALPILYRRNTFYFQANQFTPTVLSSLGRYSLLNIRSISIVHYVDVCDQDLIPPWSYVFPLTREMRLERLKLGFAGLTDQILGVQDDSWRYSDWAYGVYALNGLHRFSFFMRDTDTTSCLINRTFQHVLFGRKTDA
ncbi:hypothetical protein B0H19DRAFT_1262596 [Mycena capillaripes]|nr:hypothetical protein B0H19DRAFT_1262596 [Mycena capillaripes]